MCRSSRILRFLSLSLVQAFVLSSGYAEARGLSVRVGASFGARPFIGAPRAAVRPGVFPGVRPGFRPDAVGFRGSGAFRGPGRFGRFGRGFGYGGFDAAGLGLSLAGDLTAPTLPEGGYGPGEGYGLEPQPAYLPASRPPCIRPLVISIGHGLRHAVRTRVVYGAPPPCGY